MLCPECRGGKQVIGYACPGFREIRRKCETCKGMEKAYAIQVGKEWREERRKRGKSMHETATELGWDIVLYSRFENGKLSEAEFKELVK